MPDPTPLIPTDAAIAWVASNSLFVLTPCVDGPPVIVRYHATIADLAQALGLLIERAEPRKRSVQTDHPKIQRPSEKYTPEQRNAALEALRKVGIIP